MTSDIDRVALDALRARVARLRAQRDEARLQRDAAAEAAEAEYQRHCAEQDASDQALQELVARAQAAEQERADALRLLGEITGERDRARADLDQARRELAALQDSWRRMAAFQDSWRRIGAIWDEYEEGQITPFEAIQAIGDLVGDQ